MRKRDREKQKNKIKRGRKVYWRASYTIEAAVVVPMLLTVWCGNILLGFSLHEEVKETAARRSELEIAVMDKIWEQDVVMRWMGE